MLHLQSLDRCIAAEREMYSESRHSVYGRTIDAKKIFTNLDC